ncbi:hypothetical protein AVEN_36440-1 [Araneus ventricosus]|uniref:Uncharacterized protein n=1 Tax=Araneus ventricosus TaxID=182803 RepID=A0A4Y2J7Q1_ARAVE|nr:hypothetical protein AVEN_36440-1 [Araneus ventricosus]
MERSQNKLLRQITRATWFVRNDDIRNTLNIKTLKEYIKKLAEDLTLHEIDNTYIKEIDFYTPDPNIKRPSLSHPPLLTQDHLRAPTNHSHLDLQASSTPQIYCTIGYHQIHHDPFKKTASRHPLTAETSTHPEAYQFLSNSRFAQHPELAYRGKVAAAQRRLPLITSSCLGPSTTDSTYFLREGSGR